MSLYRLDQRGDLTAPTLLVAFDGWVDAGSAATTALEHVVGESPAIATFDADELFDYRARRPPLEIVDGRLAELSWPELLLRHVRIDERDLLVLVGPEPDYRWREMVSAVLELLTHARRRASGSASGPSRRPCRTPGPCRSSAPSPSRACSAPMSPPDRPASCACRRRWSRRSNSRSRTRASRPSATSRRSRTTSPGRTRRPPWPCSGPLGQHLGISLPPGDLADEAEQLRTRLDAAASVEETTRTYVERLESMVDEERLPAGDDLIADIERFLRDRGGESTSR